MGGSARWPAPFVRRVREGLSSGTAGGGFDAAGPRQLASVEDAMRLDRLMGLDTQNRRVRNAVFDRLQPAEDRLE